MRMDCMVNSYQGKDGGDSFDILLNLVTCSSISSGTNYMSWWCRNYLICVIHAIPCLWCLSRMVVYEKTGLHS